MPSPSVCTPGRPVYQTVTVKTDPLGSGAAGVITSLFAGHGVPFCALRVANEVEVQLGAAGRRQQVVPRPAHVPVLRGLVRGGPRVVLPARVAGERRLHEPEAGRRPVDLDPPDGQVRADRELAVDRRSRSRLKLVRHWVARSCRVTWLPGRNRLRTAS